MSARNLGEARASLDEARVLLLRREKSAPYPGEGCLPPLTQLSEKEIIFQQMIILLKIPRGRKVRCVNRILIFCEAKNIHFIRIYYQFN